MFDRLEVFDGFDLQLEGGVFVDDDHGVWVLLQGGEGPHVVDAAFDAFLEGEGFVGARNDDDDFAGLVGVSCGILRGKEGSLRRERFARRLSGPFLGLG